MFTLTATSRGAGAGAAAFSADTAIMGAEEIQDRGPINFRIHTLTDGSHREQIVGRTPDRVRIRGAYAIDDTAAHAEWVKLRRMKGLAVDVSYSDQKNTSEGIIQNLGVGLVVDVPTRYDIRIYNAAVRRSWALDLVMRDRGWEAFIQGYTGKPIDNPFEGVDRDGTTPTMPPTPTEKPALVGGLVISRPTVIDAGIVVSSASWGEAINMAPARVTNAAQYDVVLSGQLPVFNAPAVYLGIAIPQAYDSSGQLLAALLSDDATADPRDTIITRVFAGGPATTSVGGVIYACRWTAQTVSSADYSGKYLLLGVKEAASGG